MRKKGSYRKNKLFCLLAVAVLYFVQAYLNDIVLTGSGSSNSTAFLYSSVDFLPESADVCCSR